MFVRMAMRFSFLTCFIPITLSLSVSAQTGTIKGTVTDSNLEPLIGVHVQLVGVKKNTVTDSDGHFYFKGLNSAEYTIKLSYLGFNSKTIPVKLVLGEGKDLRILFQEKISDLEEIIVSERSESLQIKESTASVSLIDMETFYNRSSESVDLLSTISGVQVKQNGGLGNSSEVSIQGLSGRQVKFFIDGVPMEFMFPVQEFGIGASLAMLPINSLERMEVYKGTVPVTLGADALGGAINIVTRKDIQEFAEFSLDNASFNTTQATLVAQKNLTKGGLFAGVSGFYTASENNYSINNVTIVNQFGNPESISANKFHDQFRSYFLKGTIGMKNKPWVDQAELSLSHGAMYDEIQHNFEMRQPYGQAHNESDIYNAAFVYKKNNLLNRLKVDLYLGFNQLNTSFVDTTNNIYNWNGEVVDKKNYGGEITTSQNDLQLKGNNLAAKSTFTYSFNQNYKGIVNLVSSYFTRSGTDEVAEEYYGANYFKEPVYVNKTVIGMGIEGRTWNNFSHTTSLKLYSYRADGFEINDGQAISINQNRFHVGFGEAINLTLSEKLLSKISYEYATRMPDRIETLGDFSFAITSNPNLRPETSHNINAGLLLKQDNFLRIEVNGFYKDVNNIIILSAVPPPVLSKYENLLKTRILGIDGEVQLKPYSWLSMRLNATFQDLRNRSTKENSGVSSNRYYGVRLPNKPFLFGSGELALKKQSFFTRNDLVQFWWASNYVKEYFRYWEIDGRKEDKLTIPTQRIHNSGISYSSADKLYTLTFELQNILNADAFDNFRVQKPGRSWHAKFRFYFKNL